MDPPRKTGQWGGTAIILRDKLLSKCLVEHGDSGRDKLGRWCWTTLRGKGHSAGRLVSVYGPQQKGSKNSAVSQQRTRLLQKGDDRLPCLAF
mmetsp:Transcript_17019/g.25760  ORF Transcript_17019/g.25760 Transcript_17019/m.25760 type:complete len:92 (-) Transcript_17019:533-808(-)